MKIRSCAAKCIVLALISLGSISWTYAKVQGNVKKGQKLYKKCVACHGKQGEGKKSLKAPKIGGQYSWYLLLQLQNFKTKKRVNPKMYPFIKNLSDKDFRDLSSYLATLKWGN